MTEKKVIKNASRAGSGNYSYSYASLADIANQGLEIPKMRIKNVFTPDGGTYIGDWIEYLDEDGNWQLGSRVVETELKGMNGQQLRGASESYSRRYTTLMALGLSCEDDKEVENNSPKFSKSNQTASKPPTSKQLEYIRKLAKEQGMSNEDIDAKISVIKTFDNASKSIENLLKNTQGDK